MAGPQKQKRTQDAQTIAVQALLNLWRAAIRRHLAARAHRKPTDTRVSSVLRQFGDGEIVWPLFRELRYFESELGKPYARWTVGEREQAALFVADVFTEAAKAFQRRRGRPKKERQSRGIIARAMRGSNSKPVGQKLEDLDRLLQAEMRGARLGAWARREMKDYLRTGHAPADAERRFSDPQAVIAYMRRVGDDPDAVLREGRLPRGALDDFLERYGVDKRLKAALKQRLWRLRRR